MMDLPSAFCFVVCFGTDATDADASFQEVGGIGAELETEIVQEGGEKRYVHQLPKGVKNLRLTLKRGLVPFDSKLVQWCRKVLEGGLAQPVDGPVDADDVLSFYRRKGPPWQPEALRFCAGPATAAPTTTAARARGGRRESP